MNRDLSFKFLILLITSINLNSGLHFGSECQFYVLVTPCSCQAVTEGDKNDAFYGLKCSEVSSKEVLQVFKSINGSKLSDRFTEFTGSKIDFSSSNGHMEPSFFTSMSRLNKISLTGSNVKTMDRTSFISYNFYDSIDMSRNEIESIPSDFFLTGSKFNFSNNRIKLIPSRAFHNFKKIDLNNNLISKIESFAFSLNSYYESKVDVKWNRLSDTSISKNFINLMSPLVLDVSFNKITFFDSTIFKGIKRLTAEDNPLSCDCRYKWIVDQSYFPFKGSCQESGGNFLSLVSMSKIDFSSCAKSLNIEDGYFDKFMFKPCTIDKYMNTSFQLDCQDVIFNEINLGISNLRGMFEEVIKLIEKLNIQRLRFHSTEENSIPETFLDMFQFKDISIIDSGLTALDVHAFHPSVESLMELDLSSNKLKDESNIFEFVNNFINVKKVVLKNNKLRTVPSQKLNSLQALKYLDLSYNQINLVESKSLSFNYGKNQYRYLLIDLGSNKLDDESFQEKFFNDNQVNVVTDLILNSNGMTCLKFKSFKSFFDGKFSRNSVSFTNNDDDGKVKTYYYCDK